MRIVDRQTFLSMPSGTLFSTYEPYIFGELRIKDDNRGTNDFYTIALSGPVGFATVQDYVDTMSRHTKEGTEIPIDLHTATDDGDFGQELYAVWSRQDVLDLITRLQEIVAC